MSEGLYDGIERLQTTLHSVQSKLDAMFDDVRLVSFDDPIPNGLDHDNIPTKIRVLDRMLQGGLGRGEIGIIMARFGHGKSTLLSILGYRAFLQGYNVLHISYEDLVSNLKKRYQSMMKHYGVGHEDRINNIFFCDCVSNALEVKQLDHLFEEAHIDVVILDYLDVVPFGSFLDVDRRRLKELTVALKRMAGKRNVAMWTATQATIERTSNGKEVTQMNATRITESKVGKGGTTDVLLGVALLDHIPDEMEITYIKGRGRPMPPQTVHRVGFDPNIPRIWSKYG